MTTERTLASMLENLHKEMHWKKIRTFPNGVVDAWRMLGDEYSERLEAEWKRRGFTPDEHVCDFGETQ